jgi:hypothetical protein
LVFFDIVNNRVGINTENPGEDFEVGGNFQVGNVVIFQLGNVDVGEVWINNLQDPVANSDAATKFYVDSSIGNIQLGDFTFIDTTISTTLSSANITLSPTGNQEVIIDTNSGLVLPTGETSERPEDPELATIRWNTDIQQLEIYNGNAWDEVARPVTSQVIVPDGSSLTYMLDRSTTAAAVLIVINGIVQTPALAYTVSNDQVTFAEAPLSTDIIDIRFL